MDIPSGTVTLYAIAGTAPVAVMATAIFSPIFGSASVAVAAAGILSDFDSIAGSASVAVAAAGILREFDPVARGLFSIATRPGTINYGQGQGTL